MLVKFAVINTEKIKRKKKIKQKLYNFLSVEFT